MKPPSQKIARLFLYVLLVGAALMCTGCLGSRKTITSNTTSTKKDSLSIKKDSIKVTQVNGAINDQLTTNIPQSRTGNRELDSLVNAKMDELLSQINTSKRSGDNSYRFYYDEQLKQLRAEFELGETRNETTEVNNEKESVSTEETTREEEIKKTLYALPWWVWAIVIFYSWPRIMAFFNPAITAAKKLRKKRPAE